MRLIALADLAVAISQAGTTYTPHSQSPTESPSLPTILHKPQPN